MLKELKIYSDGGSRGNPGPSGIGVVIWEDNKVVGRYSKYLGEATNNQAEYAAVLFGLEQASRLGAEVADCYLDSELVVSQLNMNAKIKNEELGVYFIKIWNLRQKFKKVTFTHIPREENHEADKLVNQAIDEGQ